MLAVIKKKEGNLNQIADLFQIASDNNNFGSISIIDHFYL